MWPWTIQVPLAVSVPGRLLESGPSFAKETAVRSTLQPLSLSLIMVRVVLSSALAAATLAATASAFTIGFDNKCSYEIDLYTREGGVYTDAKDTIAVGGSCSKTLGKGFEGHFRHGESVAATLVEFATKGDYALAWYDISIIPPSLEPGWEFCSSLEECKEHSPYGVGFNVPVSVTPQSNTDKDTCEQLTCPTDGCTDAYLFPKDDGKTHSCAMDTDFIVTFCPDGSTAVANSAANSTSVSDEGDYTQGSAAAYGSDDYSESASEATETPEVTTATPTTTPVPTPVPTTATPVTYAPVATTATPVTAVPATPVTAAPATPVTAAPAAPSTEDAGTKKPKICDM